MKLDEIDFKSDSWFTGAVNVDDIPTEFKEWWIEFYGEPSDYMDLLEEQHEYWLRCGFAFFGWIAANEDKKQKVQG